MVHRLHAILALARKGVWDRSFGCSAVILISNTCSSTARLSGSTSMGPGQKGDSKSGHRPLAWRPTTKIGVLIDALGNLVRFVLLSGQRTTVSPSLA